MARKNSTSTSMAERPNPPQREDRQLYRALRRLSALARTRFVSSLLLASSLSACGGSVPESATKNRVFYDWTTATSSAPAEFEQHYPPLDFAGAPPVPEYMGVTVLRGGIHLSRPKGWLLRDASNQPGQAYVQYISPSAYSFAIYERPESPEELWRDVLRRYEDDAQAAGARVSGKRVPVGVGLGQGRAYTVERNVEATKRPFLSRSREYVLRGSGRVVLVQIVHDSENLSAVEHELLRVIDTLEVL
ncbi:MAG TPA: hypothetical protein VFQ61_29750 [Polyangiaceae bacterium]|nr:hypothetical protein [Polyangiaceae bacterium]